MQGSFYLIVFSICIFFNEFSVDVNRNKAIIVL